MGILLVASIIILCAFLVLLRPDLINVLSEADRKKMNPKKTGRAAFWGLMTTALILVALWLCGIRNELVPMFVGIPGAILTAALIQLSIPNK
jgi:4-hydroxybenzoate polyprenyltransferase